MYDHVVVMFDKILLEAEPSQRRVEFGRDRVVGHGQQPDLHAPALAQFARYVALGRTLTESLGAGEVGREVAVTQAEPRGPAQLGQFVHDAPRLALQTPPEFGVVEPRQGVADRVEIWADGEPVQHQIVANVHDRGDLAGVEHATEGTQKSCGTNAAAENRYHD